MTARSLPVRPRSVPWALTLLSALLLATPARPQEPPPGSTPGAPQTPPQTPPAPEAQAPESAKPVEGEATGQSPQEPAPAKPPEAAAPPVTAPVTTTPPGATPTAPPAAVATRTQLDLTLEQALKLAVDHDIGLQIADVEATVAGFEYAGSWGSFDPVLTSTGALTNSEFEANSSLSGANVVKEDTQELSGGLKFPLSTGGEFNVDYARVNRKTNSSFQLDNPSTTDTLTLSFRQPLLRGGWSRYATSRQREQEILYGKSLERVRGTRQKLLLDVHSAYWELVATIEQEGVAAKALELGQQQLEQNRRRLAAGVGTEVEVLQAETTVAQRFEERLLASVNARAAQDKLKSYLFPGTDPERWDTHLVPVTPLPTSTPADVPAWDKALAVALTHRSELRELRLEMDAAELRLDRAKSESRWGLDLDLSTSNRGFDGDSAKAFESATSFEYPANRASLTLNVPIMNRTASNAERAARARGRTARLQYAQQESMIASEVREAVRQIVYQSEAVKAAAKSLELAERQLVAEEARYREGLSTNFQVLEFQKQLAEALSKEKRARVSYAKAIASLTKAEGILGERESR